MYYVLFVLLILTLFSSLFFHCRRKKIITKICCMEKCQKCSILDELAQPLGYSYHCSYGFFSSTIDAWQRKTGYTYLYDYMAPRFQMIFDCLPIYFNYDNRTWMIEFWKGQYGINTGAEIGIYHADKIISPENYRFTLFDCANDEEMLPCSLLLAKKNGDYVRITKRHWWLTAFLPGSFSNPSDLRMETSLTFPNKSMLSAFVDGLYQAEVSPKDFQIHGLRIFFNFRKQEKEDIKFPARFQCRFSQWKNKVSCKLYLLITKPFSNTTDRILYLYYCLPLIFRRTLRLHRFDKRCHRKQCCMRKRS